METKQLKDAEHVLSIVRTALTNPNVKVEVSSSNSGAQTILIETPPPWQQ